MKSHNTLIRDNLGLARIAKQGGFTLTEILVSIGILAIIMSLGLFISLDFLRSYSFRSEQEVIVSLLQNARSQSLNNINQVRHGVHFENPLKYIVFECRSAAPQCTDYSDAETSKDLLIEPSYNSSVMAPGLPFDVIFEQLSGNCTTSNCSTLLTITTSDGVKSYDIKVNGQGQIDW